MARSNYSGFSGGGLAQQMHPNPTLLQNQKRHESLEVLKNESTTQRDRQQEEIWREFNNHFKNEKRNKGKQINHHDFLDPSFLPKKDQKDQSRRTFFSQVGGLSMDPYGTEDAVNLGRERLNQTRKNYLNLQKQSYEIPLNREKATIPKWLVQKLKAEGKSLEPRVYQMNKTAPKVMKQAVDE